MPRLQTTPANTALRAALKSGKRANKFGAVRTKADGYSFDSLKEARRYGELKLLQRAGKIVSLEIHPVYSLLVAGEKVGTVEFDFRYRQDHPWLESEVIIEDVKSKATNTPLSKLKRSIFEAMYGMKVRLL